MSPYKNRKLEKIKLIVFMKFIPQNKKNRRKQEMKCKKK